MGAPVKASALNCASWNKENSNQVLRREIIPENLREGVGVTTLFSLFFYVQKVNKYEPPENFGVYFFSN